ncbi:DUF4266 domain-containing protein [Undibacterium sp. TS12]|uniref:DUF4266 domain-containing protein n=1 Tax=Undibacterium sp. TS12 TaxID=2908202 RepID=UPI001F4D0785|nr:DUF4266 domain-containing protein [Undibacterium sp. TS12]MCH8617551.1 DUF4266 domain-containing protein [Undibacterium sp. TS12]
MSKKHLSLIRLAGLSLLGMAMSSLSACSQLTPFKQVQAWEKGMLAKPAMTFEEDRLAARFSEHMYTSKEAASGGAGVGGGGCGCN